MSVTMSAKRKAFPTTPKVPATQLQKQELSRRKKGGADASDSSEDSADEGVLEPASAKGSCQRDILFILTN
jgi:hypothetical protein